MEETREIVDESTGEKRELKVCNGGITEAHIQGWKSAHRKVHAIEVEDDGDLIIGYFKRPTMDTMSAVNKLSKSDEVKSTAVMFENCWLGGDPVMQSDSIVRMAAIAQLGVMFGKVTGTLKNL